MGHVVATVRMLADEVDACHSTRACLVSVGLVDRVEQVCMFGYVWKTCLNRQAACEWSGLRQSCGQIWPHDTWRADSVITVMRVQSHQGWTKRKQVYPIAIIVIVALYGNLHTGWQVRELACHAAYTG